MYKILIFINGCLLTLMFLLNKLLSQEIGIYRGTVIFHIIGLLTILIVSKYKRAKVFKDFNFKYYFVFPGVFSLIMTVLNNITIPNLGISIVTSLGLFGQLIISIIFETYGILGVQKKKFMKEKLFGFTLLLFGILFMAIF